MSGIESTFAAENLGTTLWLACLVVLLIIMYKVNMCCCITERLIGSFHWSGSIRFFVQAYFDFVMFISINLKYVKHETVYHSVKDSNAISYILLVVTVLMTIFITVFYWKNRNSWEQHNFKQKYGSILEGFIIGSENKWQVMAMLVLFMVRRVLFVVVVLQMNELLPVQLGFIQLTVLFRLGLILKFPMFVSSQKKNIEIMNELTLLAATYFAHLFSDLVFDAEDRYNTGFV